MKAVEKHQVLWTAERFKVILIAGGTELSTETAPTEDIRAPPLLRSPLHPSNWVTTCREIKIKTNKKNTPAKLVSAPS